MPPEDFRIKDYLSHIEEAVDWILQFTEGMTESEFLENVQCQLFGLKGSSACKAGII